MCLVISKFQRASQNINLILFSGLQNLCALLYLCYDLLGQFLDGRHVVFHFTLEVAQAILHDTLHTADQGREGGHDTFEYPGVGVFVRLVRVFLQTVRVIDDFVNHLVDFLLLAFCQ